MNIPSPKPYNIPDPSSTNPKRSLILAGGGMRVAYQAGVVRALFESGLGFTHADGTSGGIMNLAMLLSGLSPIEMCDRWRTLDVKHFVSLMPLKQYLKAPNLIAMGDADGIINHIFPHFGIDVAKINAVSSFEGTFNVCNFTHKTNEVFSHRNVDIDLLVAGISLPLFMPPIQKGEFLYTDSVWIKDANLMEAVRRGADEIWVVWCIGNSSEYKLGAFNQYVHMIELSANGALFEECDRIQEINQRIQTGEVVYGHTKPIKLHLIKPTYPLPLDPDFFCDNIDAATLIDMGYADAKQYLQTAPPEGLPFHPHITRMKDSALGITFREVMAGEFAMGETEALAGAAKGKAHGSTLTLRTAINIRDLNRFLTDPDHTGDITGHISLVELGENIPAKQGHFNLFSPSDNPKLKYITYELAFEVNGKEYYLVGKKEIHDDPGFDLWKDSTTLFIQLHQGNDAIAPTVGAGILHLDVNGLKTLISSMHIANFKSIPEKAQALSKFGKLFLGELWETYA